MFVIIEGATCVDFFAVIRRLFVFGLEIARISNV